MDAECTEAVYNIGKNNVAAMVATHLRSGLTCKRLGSYAEALAYFEKLLLVLPDNADVIYQMADM